MWSMEEAYQEGRTGVFSWCVILFSVKREFNKLFFVIRDRYSWWFVNFIRDPWFVVFSGREPCDRPPLYDPLPKVSHYLFNIFKL